jgi:hypothetical protein
MRAVAAKLAKNGNGQAEASSHPSANSPTSFSGFSVRCTKRSRSGCRKRLAARLAKAKNPADDLGDHFGEI